MNYLDHFKENGFTVVKGVFAPAEVAELAAECDRLKAEGMAHAKTYRDGNLLYLIAEDPRLGRIVRFAQWPAYVSAVLARYRVDARLLKLVEPLIGGNLKQIINQVIWKPPGASETSYAYHQDCRFRRPRSAYRDLGGSYVQTAIALDPHRPENGCMRMYPGSHRLGDLALGVDESVMRSGFDDGLLRARGLDPANLVDLVADPGDVAMWTPYTVHGSAPNRSTIDRRFYVNGYVAAANCDRGEWAFRDGKPCQVARDALIQYDDLHRRPEPHYVDGSPYRYEPD